MSFGGTIPQIAITPDANESNLSAINIAETLTDVEDLEEADSSKVRSKLKIKLSNDRATTDVEDLEGSDSEIETKIRTVLINDFHLDTCNVEEKGLGNSGKVEQNFRLRPDWMNVTDDGVTDAEDFVTDDEIDLGTVPEPDIDLEEYQADYVNISSDYKPKLEFLLAAPVSGNCQFTDIESVDSEEENCAKRVKPKKRKSKISHKNKSDVDETPKPQRCLKMKKSLSHPCSLKPENGWFESDGEAEDNNFLKSPRVIRQKKVVLTDTEDLCDDIEDEASPVETDVESIEGEIVRFHIPEIILPAPVRTIICLHEDKSLVPTTKILPLDEVHTLGLIDEEDGGTTDVEFFEGEGDLLVPENYNRAPTPDICGYEYSNVVYGENRLDISKPIEEPVTDTEDLNVGERTRHKKCKNKTLQIVVTNDQPTTDTEDFYLSDSAKSPKRKQRFGKKEKSETFVPYYMKDSDGSIISSKDLDARSTTRNRLNVKKAKFVTSSPDLTDVEDLVASAEDDVRSQTATPNEFSRHLEQQRASKVHIQNTGKLDFDSPTETMYLKGGSYYQAHTDVEDISEENEDESVREWDVSKKSASQEEAPSQDAEQQGLSTTTERLVASNEETLLDKPLGQQLTGLSVIDDYLVTDLKTVIEQTNAFIQSESLPEPYDALAEKYTRKEPINEKKVDDNKNNMNEKKKAKKGFFGSIKTFVERSFESDSESEKSPKKSKKPKKDKKKKAKDEQGLPPRKPKLPTPPLEPSDIDSIPFVEASVSDLPPSYKPPDIPIKEDQVLVTDLDIDLNIQEKEREKTPKLPEVKEKPSKGKEREKTPKLTEVKEKSQERISKEKDKKKSKAQTVVVEEVTKTIEPFVIESEEFSIVVDPTKKESPKKSKETFTINIDESIEKKEKEIMEKSPILSEEKIVKPLAALEQINVPVRPPRAKDHIYEDIEDPLKVTQDQIKEMTTNLIQNEINNGAWSDLTSVPQDDIQKEIVEKQDKEILKEKDADSKKKDEKKSGFFSLFKKRDSKKDDEVPTIEKIEKKPLSESVLKDMADSKKFISDEVENYHDVRPILAKTADEDSVTVTTSTKPEVEESKPEESKAQSDGFFGLFKKPKKDEKTVTEKKAKKDEKKPEEKKLAVILSEEVLRNILDSKRFLEGEIQNYDDARQHGKKEEKLLEAVTEPSVKKTVEDVKESKPKEVTEKKEKIIDLKAEELPKKLVEDVKEPSPKKIERRESSPKPSGIFGLFKKSKDTELAEEVVKEIKETDQFLVAEVEKYEDAKPTPDEKKVEEVEGTQATDAAESQSSGFFGFFKKSKKEEEVPPAKPQLSETTAKEMEETNQFLTDELQNYEDAQPIKKGETTAEKKVTESVEEPSSGFFGLFKKAKKEDEKIAPEKECEEVTVDTKDKKTVAVEDDKIKKVVEEVRESSPKPGFFGLFKKSKKDEEETIPIKPPLSDSVLKDMKETSQFLSCEVENYHDVKPAKFERIQEEIVDKTLKETVESSPKTSRGLFGIFKKTKKDQEQTSEPKKTILSDTVVKEMNDTRSFLNSEIENYHDVKPEKFELVKEENVDKEQEEPQELSPKSRGIFGIFKKSKRDSVEAKPVISESVINDMKDTDEFLSVEVENYHDVKTPQDQQIVKVSEEIVESSPKPSRGLFGIFKKSKKDEEEASGHESILSESIDKEVMKDIVDEAEKTAECKPEKTTSVEEEKTAKPVEERTESSPSRGLFGIFKKSKKEEDLVEPKLTISEEVAKDMADTNTFLNEEVQNYHDVKPEKVASIDEEKVVKTVEERTESSPSRGLFGIFKKSKKEDDLVQPKSALSEEVSKDMDDTSTFLLEEIQNYHDVKPEKVASIDEEKIVKNVEERTESSPSRSLFGIFKKSKKEEDLAEPKSALLVEVAKDTADTTALVEDVEKYHYVKPEKTVSLDEEKVVKTVEEKTESLPTRGIFSIFKKSKKEEESVEPKVALSEDVVKDMTDTDKFIAEEVQNYHDVKPAKQELIEERVIKTEEEKTETSSSSLFGIFKKSKKEDEDTKQKISLSEQVVKEIDDTNKFLNDEVKNYHDVKPDANVKETELVEEEKVPKSVEEKTESLTRGILGIFKKSNKEEEGTDAKSIQKEVEKTQEFISSEVAKYEDAKPVVTAEEKVALKESVEETGTKTEVKVGFLAKFKKTKKKTSLPDTQLSEEVQKQMDDTKKFISLELENYEDGTIKSPDKDKKEEKTVTFEDTTSKMVMESHLPQVEIAHVVEVAVKEDAADLVKDTTEQVEKVEEILSKEATRTQQAVEEELKLSKKDKQTKEKKSFFNRFGKKSKSQEASFDESRGRLSEESEVSPKKQKRRKSSSPFKFFEKMKKSEEEVKEVETEESQILTQTESVTKEEPKDDLMTIEFDKEAGINLSEEVLGSLEKKMEELKRKYSPEAQKQMNDCRDFLFIEVDNYEDAKPVIVTDIDTGISSDASKAVDDIIDTAAKVVEKSTTQATEIKTDVSEAVTKSETEDSKNGEGSKKKEKKGDRKSGGFFSKLGNLISGSVEETKSEIKEAKKSAEKRVEKVKETTQKTIEKTKDDIKDAKDKVTKEADEKIKEVETTTSQKVDEAKEGILSLKESLLEATSKVGKKIDDVKKDTGSKAEQIKDSTLKTIDDSKQKAELAIDKTKTDLLDARDQKMEKVKQKTEEAKGTTEKTVTAAVETGVSKVDEFQKEIEEKITDVRTQAATLLEEAEQETLKTSKETKESVEEMKKIQHEVTKSGEEKMKKISLKGEQVFDTTEKQVEQLKKDSEKAKVEVEDAAKKKIQDITATINTEIREVEETTKQKIDEAIKVKDKIVADALVKAGHTMVELAKADGDMKNAVGETTEELEKTVSQKINGFEKSKEITEKAATKKLEDPSKSKETIKSTGETKLEELTTSTIQKIEDVKKVKEEFKVTSEEKIKDLVKTSSTLVDEFEKTKEETKEAVVQKVEEASKDMKKIVDTKVDEISEMKKEVESTMLGKAEEIQKEASKKVEDLVKVKEDVSKSASQKVDEFAKVKVSTKDVLSQKTDEICAFKQSTTDQLYRTHENLAETAETLKQKTTKTTEEISKLKESTKDTFSKKIDEISKKAVKKGEDISAAFSAADEAVNGFHKSTAQKLNKLDKTKEDVIADLTKLKESSSEKIGETAKSKESAIEDLIRIEKSLKDTSSELSKGISQKTDDFIRTREKAIDDIEKIKSSASSKIDNATKATTTKLEETVDQTTKETAAKMVELDNELSKLTSSLEQLAEPIAKQVETVKSYVTSPTMARRAESQRFTRDERPTVREVKSEQQDEDSDEEHYTVMEPEEVEEKKRKPLFHLESEDDDSFESPKPKDRRDSVKSNVLETLSENKLDNLLTNLETQLVKDLDRSVTEVKEKSESKLEKAELELETIKKDSQADVNQIEQKLRDLDKALDSLEQASDPKLEKKLHRVERKFERMASEVMEKDVTEASPTEVEARREHEFQKLVSQLSTEEVSDFQKEYSHLWDETTFSKSDEWDSKTPDSQADVQELPQGEVVYLGPVTLNKDHLVNKAGVQVDVIPIMRSPCHTPKPSKKNKRAKSAMDFYKESNPSIDFNRGSLPDLKKTYSKGSLVSAVSLNPDRFLYGSTTSLRSTESSSSEISKGEIMNAVLDWLDKSGGNTNLPADCNSATPDSKFYQIGTTSHPFRPAIRITSTNGIHKKQAKRKGKSEKRETTATLTEDTKTIPQPKPRFAKDTPLQFKDRQPKLEKQISPVRDDLLDDEDAAVPETYSDKKKFWENVTKDKRMSLTEVTTTEKDFLKKRVSVHEVPIPKPRSQVQVSQSIDEKGPSKEEEEETKIMSEYQASFQPPSERKTKTPPKLESDKESSTDSESDNVCHSGTNENAGYISDSGDVEHYISDSEIEDRVPQIRERQMSVFAPPVASARKTIYERSASLPTEDLYEVSARSSKLRKQYYEEQIKKEMIEEQLTSEIEEEPSPERKTLISSLLQQASEEKITVRDIARSFDEATKKEVSFEDDRQTHKPDETPTHIEDHTAISTQIQETHKEIDGDAQTKRSSLGSEQSSSSDVDKMTRNESTSKPDSMEVHVDKSEIEDSEKLAELDQDATDLETKSLDSLNAVEMSPKSTYSIDEAIPEITVTLSGKQRRISEESDEYAPKAEKKPADLDSPINVPEEHVEDTVWEVSVQSQPEARFDEKVTSFDGATVEKLEKEDDLSLSTRDESDLGSEIHQDHSDSYASDKIKSESHSDIERIILDSLHQQKVDPVEAKAIASALIEEIETEIHKRESMPPSATTGDVSDYLKYLAETKGLDEREVELVESVLARRQRELAKLSRGDTQASSIEITDEDLRYSGTELDTTHLLEQQISQLKAEKIDDIKSMAFMDKIDEKHAEESHQSKDYETCEDGVITAVKSDFHTKSFESVKGEKSENRDTIFEEDETISESGTQETQHTEAKVEAVATETLRKKTEDKEIDEYRASSIDVFKEKTSDVSSKKTEIDSEDSYKQKIEDSVVGSDVIKSIIKHHIDVKEKSPTDEIKLKGEIICEDYSAKEESRKKEATSEIKEIEGGKVEKEAAVEESHIKTIQKEFLDKEIEEIRSDENKDTTTKQTKISSKVVLTDIVHESSSSSETKEKIEIIDLDPSQLPIGEIKIVEKHEEIKRTSSSESKSSIESGKSPEDQFSTCSSGRKGDSDSSKMTEKPEVLMRKTSSLSKVDRKSGIDFETYSSSGESHYHSFELDSGKSRPCSSDVEGLVAAGSSEYESALTSQDYSSRSHITSTEYHTAVSSLSSKESMKSLDSESSGHLGSVEISELSETLVPSASDLEGDILDTGDQLDGWNEDIEDELSDKQSKMKRSHEMTFQPEPKLLASESSPQTEEVDKKFTSMDDGSVVSMSLSSTSGTTEPRTVIELSRADSERIEGGSMSVSGISDQLSIEGSCDSLVFHQTTPLATAEMSTSTGQIEGNLQIESITFTTSMVNESGIRSVSTQVTSESHSPEEDRSGKPAEAQPNGKCPPEIKKKCHRRQESTSSFVPPMMGSFEQKYHSELTESDKYTAELSFKEVISDEKKDVDEREKEESYETEADQGFHRDVREGKYQETEEEIKDDTPEFSSETQASVGELEQEYTSALARAQEVRKKSETSPDLHIHKEPLEKRDSHGKSSSTSSEKSSFEEAEAEAAFNMVAHVSPAHKIKQICPILEDEDAEKHELETRERAQKEYEKRRSQIRDQSPGSIPDIKVTQHMTPLVDRNFHYPDLELEEQERAKEKEKEKEKESETQKSTPQTPSSKSSEDTDQGREYVLEDSGISIPEEPKTESKSTVIEQTVKEEADKDTDSPNSDSFEMLEKPDLIDDFVVIEEVAKEAHEFDSEGKSVSIKHKTTRRSKKHDEEVEAYLTKSAPTPLTKMTDVKFYPDGSSSEELGFDFEDSPPINNEASVSSYEKELEANKKWIEQQFQGDQAARMAAGYDYEMEFERGPLEDIKEEDINDFDPTSSRIGSLGSQKESGGSLGSVKDSYSSTPEYDVLAGRKYFTRSGEHDDVSMSSLQEFENLERAMSLETKRCHQGSQDSSSNGSFKTRYYASKSGQGDDVSVSSLKEFEGLEMACIAAHKVEVKAKEEEAILAQIDEGQESLASESESCETISRTDKKLIPDSDEEDYEKRMFEIDEIIKQAQTNVERFIDLKEGEKTESLGRGDSIEEVSKVPDLDLDVPLVRSTIKVQWKESEDVMVTSTDSIDGKIEEKGSQHDSTDSLDQKTGADIMTASTDSIEFQSKKTEPINLLSDSIEIRDEALGGMISSDSLELAAKQGENMLESTDSLVDPTSSTATHATYQYETDSVFSGSFTSGGSNTMVSSTDTIDPVQVDIAAAARKVWFDEDTGSRRITSEYIQDSSKPYVTEVIEPSDEEGFSHTIHRRVELPPEIKKITFHGSDADERLRQFIEDFNEGEHVEEIEEVDAAGNVHTKRVVQKRFIVEGPEMEEFVKKSVASKTNQLTTIPKETTGEEPSFAATSGSKESSLKAQTSRRRQLRYEISVDDQIEVDPREHDWRFNLPEHVEGEESGASGHQGDRTSQQRSVADQHQLSEEMKQLLKELEKESKQ